MNTRPWELWWRGQVFGICLVNVLVAVAQCLNSQGLENKRLSDYSFEEAFSRDERSRAVITWIMDTSFTKERKLVNYKINEFLIFLKIKTNINSKENKENKTLEEELPSMDLIIRWR